MKTIQTVSGMQFTSEEFQESLSVCGVKITLEVPEQQEMNCPVELTYQTLWNITHSIRVHARVSDKYIHFSLIYTTDHIFPVLPIKHLVNQDGESTTPNKLATSTKHSLSNLRVLFCPCVVQKANAQVDTKALNMH